MMCPTRILIRTSLARTSIWALAVAGGLILSAIEPGGARDEVRAHARNADSVSPALSGYEERAYRCYESRRFGEMSESELKGKPETRSQRRSVACRP
jgi:hypothetical protein